MKRLSLFGACVVLSACSQMDVETQETSSQTSEIAAQAAERYIVAFKPGADRDQLIRAAGGQKVLDISGQNASAVMLPAAAADALSRSAAVEYVEVDPKRYLYGQRQPYGIDMVQAPQVWAAGATGANRQVCIIDSGLYTAHEDHQSGKTITGYPTGWNTDKCDHGTHVAGTIGAVNNSLGVVGVLPNGVNLQIIKVFGDDCGWTYASGLADAMNRCASGGSNVISMSLGGGTKSATEQTAVNNAFSKGLLIVAAAGNGGNRTVSYPASYNNVISVAAVDSTGTVASFSQFNAYVDIAAPGVGVESTVGEAVFADVTANGATYSGSQIEFAANSTGVTGQLVDGGICDKVGAWGGKVVLCQRGTISFFDKVKNVQTGGGVGAVLYNNVSGGFAGTLGSGNTSTIPAIGISMEDGNALKASAIGASATERSYKQEVGSGYAFYDGTSMATPHVSAVAALIWSYNTSWTNTRVQNAIFNTALDKGAAGRDNYYGYGIIQAKKALDYAIANP